nr:uncharacterized protein LOC124812317 isoform X8 [Hydra vulgaris]
MQFLFMCQISTKNNWEQICYKSNMHRLQLFFLRVLRLIITSSAVTPSWWVKYDHLNEKMYTSAVCNLGVITSQPHL